MRLYRPRCHYNGTASDSFSAAGSATYGVIKRHGGRDLSLFAESRLTSPSPYLMFTPCLSSSQVQDCASVVMSQLGAKFIGITVRKPGLASGKLGLLRHRGERTARCPTGTSSFPAPFLSSSTARMAWRHVRSSTLLSPVALLPHSPSSYSVLKPSELIKSPSSPFTC